MKLLGHRRLFRAILFTTLFDESLLLFPFSELFSVIFVVKEDLIYFLNQIDFSTLKIELADHHRCLFVEKRTFFQDPHLQHILRSAILNEEGLLVYNFVSYFHKLTFIFEK